MKTRLEGPRLRRRRSRSWLYGPFVMLALIAAGWSAFWFVVQGRVAEGIEDWRAKEAAKGRAWACPQQAIGGFPFRIELTCEAPTLTWGPDSQRLTANLGGLLVVAQVYDPNRIIAEARGPATVNLPDGGKLDLGWKDLRASIGSRDERIERFSLVSDGLMTRLTRPEGAVELASVESLDLQMRPDPARWTNEGAADVAVTAKGASLPMLDRLVGTKEPADLSLRSVVTRVSDLPARNPVEALEAWRTRGGTLELSSTSIAKGAQKIELRGLLALDDQHRPAGKLDLSAAGLDQIVSRLMGGGGDGTSANNVASLVIGGLNLLAKRKAVPPAAPETVAPAAPPSLPPTPGLTPLPALTLRDGRLSLGPIGIADLPPLY